MAKVAEQRRERQAPRHLGKWRKPAALVATGKITPMSAPTPAKAAPEPRSAYKVFRDITTRWIDNDSYGHVNNVVYYSWFDTAVNAHLIEQGALDIAASEVIGLVVETHCNYFAPVSFPQTIRAGLRVAHIGNSSVRYEIGLFIGGQAQTEGLTVAKGHFVHVYVNRANRKPVAIAGQLKTVLEALI